MDSNGAAAGRAATNGDDDLASVGTRGPARAGWRSRCARDEDRSMVGRRGVWVWGGDWARSDSRRGSDREQAAGTERCIKNMMFKCG